jgi:hypothetical protein
LICCKDTNLIGIGVSAAQFHMEGQEVIWGMISRPNGPIDRRLNINDLFLIF